MALSGRRVVVVGATGDIGAALCRELVARGALVTAVARTAGRLQTLAEELGGATRWICADVTDAEGIRAAMGETAADGAVAAVVATAGCDLTGLIETTDPETVRSAVELNVLGTWFTVRAALPVLRESRGYLLVNSSLAAVFPTAPIAGYAMTKAAMSAIARGARREALPDGVTVGLAEVAFTESALMERMTTGPVMRPMTARFLRVVPVIPIERIAAGFADAIEHRRRHVVLPRRAWPITLASPLFLPLLEHTLMPRPVLVDGISRLRDGTAPGC